MRNFLLGVLTGAVVLLTGIMLGGQAAPNSTMDVLRATRIEIVDDVGTVRLALGSNDAGGTVSVRDKLGRTALLAAASDDGGVLVVNHRGARQPALIASAVAAGGELQVFDADGERVVEASGDAGGRLRLGGERERAALELGLIKSHGTITGRAPGGGMAFRIGADNSGRGLLQTYAAATAKPLIALGATPHDQGTIKTLAPSGRPLVLLTATKGGNGQLFTSNDRGVPLVAAATHDGGATLRVFNADGNAAVTIEADEAARGTVGLWAADGSGRRLLPAE